MEMIIRGTTIEGAHGILITEDAQIARAATEQIFDRWHAAVSPQVSHNEITRAMQRHRTIFAAMAADHPPRRDHVSPSV